MGGLDEVAVTASPVAAGRPPHLDRTRSPRPVLGQIVSHNEETAGGNANPMCTDDPQIVSALQSELDRQVIASEQQEAELCALRVQANLLMDQLVAVPALLSQHEIMASEM